MVDKGLPQGLLMSHKDSGCSRLDCSKPPKRGPNRAGSQQLQGTRRLEWTESLLASRTGGAEHLWPS